MDTSKYLIVGAGCFGASTALALKKAEPNAEIVLIDRTASPCLQAAGHDLNKVIRTDYEDEMYMKLALEALHEWQTNPIFNPYFHQRGIIFNETEHPVEGIIQSYEKILGQGNSPAILLDPEDAKTRFDGVFRDGDWTGVTKCLWNPHAGWGDAANALKNVIDVAIGLGVKYVQETVLKINFDSSGKSSGVITQQGSKISADKVILCTGAFTPWLLAESAPYQPEIHAGHRMVATASIMCAFKAPEDQMIKFDNAPIIIDPMGEYPAECIPASVPGFIKCTHERGFTHNVFHETSNQEISVPPSRIAYQTWSQDVPDGLKDEIKVVRNKLFGNWIENMEPKQYRMCWDAITPSQDWIISPHPHAPNLFIVGGGSFHAWKFSPNVGKYVVQMLKGELGEEFAKRWHWDNVYESDKLDSTAIFKPSRDLKDVLGYS